MEDVIFSFISLLYVRNMRGTSTAPCGTPDLTGAASDDSPHPQPLFGAV